MSRLYIIGIFAVLSACVEGSPVKNDPCLEQAPTAEIGTGETQWIDLADGDGVTMVHGPQGGWHILASARVAHMGRNVQIQTTIVDIQSEATVADNTYDVALQMDSDCGGHYTGMYAYLDVSELAQGEQDTPPEILAYNELLMTMTVFGPDDRVVEEQTTILALPDPIDMD